jgi:thiol-disulfide isomerase/thioredoxin
MSPTEPNVNDYAMRHVFFAIFLVMVSYTAVSQTQLPHIQLSNLDSKTKELPQFLRADISVISFWATWCIPCINELEAIQEVYDEWVEAGFELLAVSTDTQKTVSKVRPMVYGKDWEYEVLFDTNQDLKRILHINAIPYLIVVKNGVIVYQRTGYNPGDEDGLFQKLLELKK